MDGPGTPVSIIPLPRQPSLRVGIIAAQLAWISIGPSRDAGARGGTFMMKILAVLCIIAGLAIATLGALVLLAQSLQWWSNGVWNPVSLEYVLEYYGILSPRFASQGILNRLREDLLELPLSLVLEMSGLVAIIGGTYLWCRSRTVNISAK